MTISFYERALENPKLSDFEVKTYTTERDYLKVEYKRLEEHEKKFRELLEGR
jgi:hypothetical protein